MKQLNISGLSLQVLNGVRLWSDRITLEHRLSNILRTLASPTDADFQQLKQSPRRSVVRLNNYSDKYPSLIIKGFPLRKIEWRLKYRRYGLAEAENYLQLQNRILAPEFHGYFEHRSLGTVKANGVLIEDLHTHLTLHDAAQNDPANRLKVLCQAIPVIRELYLLGINHIDTTAHNLLLADDGGLTLIDWQYCSFIAPEDDRQLILQAAQFLRYTDLASDLPAWTEWLGQLHNSCQPSVDWQRFSASVAALQSMKRPPAADRLTLTVDLPHSRSD